MTVSEAYKVLGLALGTSYENVKLRYQQLRSMYHPDKGGDATKFDNVLRAYEVLAKNIVKCTKCEDTGFVMAKHGVCRTKIQCPMCKGGK